MPSPSPSPTPLKLLPLLLNGDVGEPGDAGVAGVYQIKVDDRIILTGSLRGPTVEALLLAFGAPTVKFFTNAVDTRTRGIDFTGRYRHVLDDEQYLGSKGDGQFLRRGLSSYLI